MKHNITVMALSKDQDTHDSTMKRTIGISDIFDANARLMSNKDRKPHLLQ